MNDVANIWIWLGFSLFLIIALGLDTYFVDKKGKHGQIPISHAITWTIVWVATALIFNFLLWLYLYFTKDIHTANQISLTFLTGYIIEKSLSVDNLFAFYMIFKQFKIPVAYQPRIFSYGIWTAIILRLGLIWLGVTLIQHFHWIIYIMGFFLFCTGIKMLLVNETEKDLTDSMTFKCIGRIFRLTPAIHHNHFFIKENGWWYITPLFLALCFIELSDVVFAFDSIPAILAITTDPFIVWSSNIFAILGLRALYFLLAKSADQFHLLKYGIAFILTFIGIKMLIEPWFKIPVNISLMIIALILCVPITISFFYHKKSEI